MYQKHFIAILLIQSFIYKSYELIENEIKSQVTTIRGQTICISPEVYIEMKNSVQHHKVCIAGNSTDIPNRKLHGYYFQNTPNIKEIEVRSLIIDKHTFHNLTQLKILTLNMIRMNELSEEVFQGLQLTDIKIWNSNVSVIQPGTFDNLQTLKSLSIIYSGLGNLKYSTVPRNVTYLDYSYNKIDVVEPTTLNGMNKLKKLILYNNKISVFDFEVYLKDNLQLEELDMALNNLTSVNKINLPNLSVLDLHSNKITTILPETFTNCKNLRRLYLSFNKLTTFDSTLLPSAGLDKLTMFDISDNHLTCIAKNTWDLFPNLRFTFFSENPFSCKCFHETITWLDKMMIYVSLSVRLNSPCKNQTQI